MLIQLTKLNAEFVLYIFPANIEQTGIKVCFILFFGSDRKGFVSVIYKLVFRIGKMLADAIEKVGKDGVILLRP